MGALTAKPILATFSKETIFDAMTEVTESGEVLPPIEKTFGVNVKVLVQILRLGATVKMISHADRRSTNVVIEVNPTVGKLDAMKIVAFAASLPTIRWDRGEDNRSPGLRVVEAEDHIVLSGDAVRLNLRGG
jgi:hypothetical protein